MGQIVEFPDVKESKEKIRRLKKELEELLLEKDHLQCVICQNIRTAYTLTFGDLEYKLYKASCDYLRLRRKKELFYRATEAYEHGDLAALKLIDAMVDGGETEEALPSSAADLEKEVKRLEDLIEGVQKAIEAMKSTPPYTWRIYLEDEEKKAEKLSQLKRDLANFETAIRTQEEAIRDLMRDEA